MNFDRELLHEIQPNVMRILQAVHKNGKIGHAYIFEGENGAGTEEMMRYFVALLFCENPKDEVPCDACRSCMRLKSGNHLNLHEIFPDGQFIKVDAIEKLLQELSKKGIEEGRKIYVIHEAERMNVKSA
ncbi:MAG: DNA polymerase III subunit delta', partial [Kurthia sp.]